MKIKFGTDGWRAVIAQEFTTDNVARVSFGVAKYVVQNKLPRKIILGFDCRFGGELFAQKVAEVLSSFDMEILRCTSPTTTPAVSLVTLKLQAGIGIILTASHNPPSYNGYKLKGHFGGPLLSEGIAEVESYIPEEPIKYEARMDLVKDFDLNEYYVNYVRQHFDLERIQQSNFRLAYDAMFGSGQFVLPKLLPNAVLFRNEWNPHFYGLSPEPIMKNLVDFQEFLKGRNDIDLSLINDGDADRIGLMDGEGNFIDSHHIMLLLLNYLVKYQGKRGKVATGFSSTQKIKQFCLKYDLELEIVPIGFKHICQLMVNEDNILLGGEESGGIAVSGHIPERDGIWNGLILAQMLLETGKSIQELLKEIDEELGAFWFKRIDLKLEETQKLRIVDHCKNKDYSSFGNWKVDRVENLDGFKYYFNDDEWLMIRPSGTEPVLRTYAEGRTEERAKQILLKCHETILA